VIRWAELVFHVLAHVRSGVPAAVFDPTWTAFVARHTTGERTIDEDAGLIASVATTHDALAEVQLLAWLFEGAGRTAAVADRPLDALRPADVDAPELLPVLVASRYRAAIEVLRAAAELEVGVVAALPPAEHDPRAMDAAFARVSAAAPELLGCRIEHVRPLMLRGRARGRRIWVGVPCARLGPTVEHVAWQAAHEATVVEIAERARARGLSVRYLPLEQSALFVLRARAERCGLGAAHAAWLGHFSALPSLERAAIEPAFVALIDQSLDAR